MRVVLLTLVSVTLVVGVWAISAQHAPEQAELFVLNESTWDEAAPRGKEVDAIFGDVVLRNKHLVAVIAQPLPTRKANMTVRSVGGCLIDLTDRAHQSDQLSCYYPGRREYPFSKWSFNSSEAKPRSFQPDLKLSGDTVSVTVRSEGNANRCTLEVTYSLATDSRALQVTSRYINQTENQQTFALSDEIRADGGKEEMVKTPNGNHELYTIEDRYWGQAYGFTAPKHTIQSNSDSRTSKLKYLKKSGLDLVSVKPGESYDLSREITAAPSRLHVLANLSEAPLPVNQINLHDADGKPVEHCRIEVADETGQLMGVAVADEKGVVNLPFAPAVYQIKMFSNGIALGDTAQELIIEAGKTNYELSCLYGPGLLTSNIVDEMGNGIPCKIELIGKADTPTPNFGPETAEFAVRNLRYAPHGEFEQKLYPGQYDVIISHGPEYDAVFTEINVESLKTTELQATLKRSVHTAGWVSGEFHSHSSPSGDNTGSQLGRVLNLVCEHLEFIPCTEHNRISSYQPHLDALKINQFTSTISGMELTGSPLPLNHQNTFPLVHHPHKQDGGGPQTDVDVAKQIQRIAAWDNGSEKLIQQNHPDIGWLFYDKDGNGEHDHGHSHAVDFIDAMEIHPIEKALLSCKVGDLTAAEAKKNRVFKWMQLLNQGYRIPGVVNTDAHYNFHGSGWLRNWIQSSTDDPAKIDHMEMVHASEEGRLVMSNGPYLKLLAESGGKNVTCGQDLKQVDNNVTLHIAVQCPNWHDIDTVCVLKNGMASKELIFTRESHPDLFETEGSLKFETVLLMEFKEDTHLIVVAGGVNSTLGPVMGPTQGKDQPTALSNPIYIDIDGNGFQPNKDTLGLPLPVKGD